MKICLAFVRGIVYYNLSVFESFGGVETSLYEAIS